MEGSKQIVLSYLSSCQRRRTRGSDSHAGGGKRLTLAPTEGPISGIAIIFGGVEDASQASREGGRAICVRHDDSGEWWWWRDVKDSDPTKVGDLGEIGAPAKREKLGVPLWQRNGRSRIERFTASGDESNKSQGKGLAGGGGGGCSRGVAGAKLGERR